MTFFTQTTRTTRTPLPVYDNFTTVSTKTHSIDACIWNGYTYAMLPDTLKIKKGRGPETLVKSKVNINPITNTNEWHLLSTPSHHIETKRVVESMYYSTLDLICTLDEMKDFAFSFADGVNIFAVNEHDIHYNRTEIEGKLLYFAITKTHPRLLETFTINVPPAHGVYYVSYMPNGIPSINILNALKSICLNRISQ